MYEGLAWYLALALIGGGGLLPATLLFGRLRSRGVCYARPLALLLVAQLVWLASALAAIPYGTGLVVAAVALLYAWSGWLGWRDPERLRTLWRARRALLAGEALFLAVFVVVLFVRAQAPAAINTEKPMDLMLLNAVHHAEELPPPDSWLAGHDVSYYHLGHVMIDVSGRLAGVAPRFGFNLGLAAAAALAAVAIAGLASDAVALGTPRRRATPWIAAGIAVLALIWVAPLEGLADLAAANGLGGEGVWGRLGVRGLPGPVEATHGVPDQFLVVVAGDTRGPRHDQRVPRLLLRPRRPARARARAAARHRRPRRRPRHLRGRHRALVAALDGAPGGAAAGRRALRRAGDDQTPGTCSPTG